MLACEKRKELKLMQEDKKLYPGDPGYKGGITNSTLVINGQSKNVRIERDSNGNIISTIITDKIFGIF